MARSKAHSKDKYPQFLNCAKESRRYLQSLNIEIEHKQQLLNTYKKLNGLGNSAERLATITSELEGLINKSADEVIQACKRIDYANDIVSLLAKSDAEAAAVIRLYFCEGMSSGEVPQQLFISDRTFFLYLKRGIEAIVDNDLEEQYRNNKEVTGDG